MRARLSDEHGIAMVAVMALMAVMAFLGVALLLLVDAQTSQSAQERRADAAFNLAEGVLDAESFALSRAWPDTPPAAGGACGSAAETTTQTLAATAATGTAGTVQNIVYNSFAGHDYVGGATWTVNVCDDAGYTSSWDDSLLGSANAWDANGQHAYDASNPTNYLRRVWVRVQVSLPAANAADGTLRTAVVGLVQVNQTPLLPPSYALVAGGFDTSLVTTATQSLSGSAVSSTLQKLLSNNNFVKPDSSVSPSGEIGVRCGLLSGCLEGAFAGLSDTALSALTGSTVREYGSSTATTDARVQELRQQAIASGTYFPQVAAGTPCLPANSAGNVVFIEQVGSDGKGTCTITSTATAKALVVGSGAISVGNSSGSISPVFSGAIYALDRQDVASPPTSPARTTVVTIYSPAEVNGGVFVDQSSSRVLIQPKPFDMNALVNGLYPGGCTGLNLVACNTLKALPLSTLLTNLISLVGLTSVVNGLAGQESSSPPAIQENDAVTQALTSYGTSGTISSTFRETPTR